VSVAAKRLGESIDANPATRARANEYDSTIGYETGADTNHGVQVWKLNQGLA